jgi:hypothetical protein
MMRHRPHLLLAGDVTPIVDSLGRVVFTQWDHLQRGQEADLAAEAGVWQWAKLLFRRGGGQLAL